MSLLELPVMGVLQFRLILEKFFAPVASPAIWGKTRVKYVTETSLRLSGEAIPMVILSTNGVGKGDLGMVTTFCSHNQVKMEAPEVLVPLHQCKVTEPSVFMVRGYTNTPFILCVTDLPRGASSTQFPLNCLHLQKLLPYYKTEVLLPCEEGRQGTEYTPFPKRFNGNAWKSCTACLTQCHYQCLHQPPPCLEEGIQTDGKSGL